MKTAAGIFAIVAFMAAPLFAGASLEITEIMYDLQGGDDNREWVEVYNNGEEDIDFVGWKLFNNKKSNHPFTVFQGDGVIKSGGYLIIIDTGDDDPIRFLTDWPNYSGVILNSNFGSLSNVGDTLILKNKNGDVIDSVSYTSDWGAERDGNSLQKIAGEWKAAAPTPGAANFHEQVAEEAPVQNEPSPSSASQAEISVGSPVSSAPVVESRIYADAGQDKLAVVGADLEFRGTALGFKKEPLSNARYVWNFGDGQYRDGQNVTHYYKYPGEYMAVLDVSSGFNTASDKVLVKVSENKIEVVEANQNFIKIKNGSNFDVNVSGWFLRGGGNLFSFPENSFIKGGSVLTVASDVTRVVVNDLFRSVELLYPNGSLTNLYILPYQTESSDYKSPSTVNGSERVKGGASAVASVLQKESLAQEAEMPNPSVLELREGNNEDVIIIGEEKSGSIKKWFAAIASVGVLGIAGLYAIRRNGGE